jgi:hypothetical protein
VNLGPEEPEAVRKIIEVSSSESVVPSEGVLELPKLDEDFVTSFPGKLPEEDAEPSVENPAFFRILTETFVLDSPSFEAERMSTVRKGAKVEVVNNLGSWLELRSRQGKSGYILKQDALRVRNTEQKS